MPRYRGSPMIGGSFWGRIVGFAKGLFRQAAPHVSKLISAAHPHVKDYASKAVDSAVESAVSHVTEKLKKVQEGNGRKRKKRIKAPVKKKKTVKKRIRRLSIESGNF
jgi:hypothetical protein